MGSPSLSPSPLSLCISKRTFFFSEKLAFKSVNTDKPT